MKKLLVPNYPALLLAAHYEFFADVDARMAATCSSSCRYCRKPAPRHKKGARRAPLH
jgi:hypothetical protein